MPFSVPQLSPYHALDRKRKIKNTHPPPHHRTGIGMGHFRRLGYGFIFKWKDKILIVQHQQFNITTSTMGISCTTPALPLELHHYNISTRWILSTQSHSLQHLHAHSLTSTMCCLALLVLILASLWALEVNLEHSVTLNSLGSLNMATHAARTETTQLPPLHFPLLSTFHSLSSSFSVWDRLLPVVFLLTEIKRRQGSY